jgi:hypothetical protein
MSRPGARHLIVIPPNDCDISWSEIGQILSQDVRRPWTPDPRYPVLRRRRRALFTSGSDDLLDVVHGHGGTAVSAGGRLRNLDLARLGNQAYHRARARWWTWKTNVARSTPPAHPWETFLAEHEQRPGRLSQAEARRRFEAQPRVLAMLALTSHRQAVFRLDPDELAAYQAGELVYTTIAWQRALVGDGVVDPDGHLHRPASPALADLIRHLQCATDLVHGLTPDRYLAAVTLTHALPTNDPSVPDRPVTSTADAEHPPAHDTTATRVAPGRATVMRRVAERGPQKGSELGRR